MWCVPPPSVDPCLVRLNTVNLMYQCPILLCALPPCPMWPLPTAWRPATENHPRIMLLPYRLPAWFSLPYLFCWTLLQSCYNNCNAVYCWNMSYILCFSLLVVLTYISSWRWCITLVMDQKSIKTPNPKCRLYWFLIELIDWRCSQWC